MYIQHIVVHQNTKYMIVIIIILKDHWVIVLQRPMEESVLCKLKKIPENNFTCILKGRNQTINHAQHAFVDPNGLTKHCIDDMQPGKNICSWVDPDPPVV